MSQSATSSSTPAASSSSSSGAAGTATKKVIREIPPLRTLMIKAIAKTPATYISESRFNRSIKYIAPEQRDEMVQVLLNSIIDAGRLTDGIFPVACLDPLRTSISLKDAKVGGKYIAKLVDQCPYLTDLDLSGCFQVTDDVVHHVISNCKKLQSFSVRNCRKITDTALRHIVDIARVHSPPSSISELYFGANNVTSEGILYLISNHSNAANFTSLHLAGVQLNEGVLQELVKRCHKLRSISFSFAEIFIDSLRDFFQVMGPNLESISISWVNSFGPIEQPSSDFVLFICRSCPRLTNLNLTGLKNVTATVLSQIIEFKAAASESDENWLPLKHVGSKFVGSSKAQIENLIPIYPFVEIEA